MSKEIPRLSESIGREGLIKLAKHDPEAFVDLFLQLEERVCELERRLAENSNNSSKPPSQDGPGKAPKSKSKSKRRTGGQKGHAGRHLKQVEHPDHVVELWLAKAPSGARLTKRDFLRWEKLQVFDLPEPKLVVTEYRVAVFRDPATGKDCKEAFPDGVEAPAQYGTGALAFMVYLHTQQHLPLERTSMVFTDLFGHSVSEGTILKARDRAAIELLNFEEDLRATLSKQPTLCADETGFRVKESLYWAHVACSENYTYYAVHDRRGSEAFRDIGVLQGYEGNLIHDCLSSYDKFCPEAKHGLCNAHVIRELTAVSEQGSHQSWANRLVDVLYAANDEVIDRGRSLTEEEMVSWNRKYDRQLRKGKKANPEEEIKEVKRGRRKRTKAQNLIKRLEERKSDYLRFMVDAEVPFTNNLAERDLRMMKLQMKISGCFRTLTGAEDFGRLRSYISTLRKNGRNLLNGIKLAMAGNPIMPADLLPE